MEGSIAMHWFRKGLRLNDNPGLAYSAQKVARSKLYPVYVMDGDSYQLKHCTALRANFLVECLQDLDINLRKGGSRLYVASGDPTKILPELWKKWGITVMTFEEDETGEPYAAARDEELMKLANKCGIEVKTFASETMHPLQKYVDIASGPVPKTMTQFEALFKKMGAPRKPQPALSSYPPSDDQDSEEMLPPKRPTDLPWPRNIPKNEVTPLWGPKDCLNLTPIVRGGETAALQQLHNTVTKHPNYVATFEKPKTSCVATETMSTTILSPYLSNGCISSHKVYWEIADSMSRSKETHTKPPVSLHGQLLWRDFNNLIAHSANKHKPASWGKMEGNKYCRTVPWSNKPELLQAWQEGRTGYPWIDACIKQLETEGWIHHLGRHAVACFLTRGDLWQSWEKGALHFESQLLDADYALNGFNWLWLSCSGFFYQYFRCYSPIAFQKKNDPNGNYIRKYLPVLKNLPSKYIYEPWLAPASIQAKAGIVIGRDYPRPIVDHAFESKENMQKMKLAYDQLKGAAADESNEKGPTKRQASSSTQKTLKTNASIKKQKKITDF